MPPVLLSPAVVGLPGHLDVPASLGHPAAPSDQDLRLAQPHNDLFSGVTLPCQVQASDG